jgi:diketogulonate reductase-like aldo/keto reductase
MTRPATGLSRRRLLAGLAALPLAGAGRVTASEPGQPLHRRSIPVSGERIPVLGMGTWRTFNVAPFTAARRERVEVLRALFEGGGALVDSSPMYGLAEAALGYCLEQIGTRHPLFAATKVWTPTRIAGIAQMTASEALWGSDGFELMQVHNMLDWQAHLPTLREWRDAARIRYIGISTSHGRRHEALAQVIRTEPDFDFVQFSYNIADREAERRLLPLARDNGKAVIVNRPFRTGALTAHAAGRPLPGWAGEIGCTTWAQALLKWIIAHPDVTCVIPATSRVDHMQENMQALRGPLPDATLRRRMVADFAAL